MTVNLGQMLVGSALFGWIVYCVFLWWMAHEEQVHPRAGDRDRVGTVPVWILLVFGVYRTTDSVNLPMAAAQVSAVIGMTGAVGVVIYCLLVQGIYPFRGVSFTFFLGMLLVAPMVPYVLVGTARFIVDRRRGR